jgi:hypothetical protein
VCPPITRYLTECVFSNGTNAQQRISFSHNSSPQTRVQLRAPPFFIALASGRLEHKTTWLGMGVNRWTRRQSFSARRWLSIGPVLIVSLPATFVAVSIQSGCIYLPVLSFDVRSSTPRLKVAGLPIKSSKDLS